jgi:hypothetical protein
MQLTAMHCSAAVQVAHQRIADDMWQRRCNNSMQQLQLGKQMVDGAQLQAALKSQGTLVRHSRLCRRCAEWSRRCVG